MSFDAVPSAGNGRLAGKRCLITGGSRNLGRALCVAFAREGARVAFTFATRVDDAEQTRHLLAELDAEPLVFQGSVADVEHAAGTVSAVLEAWSGLDVLVNNAAVTQVVPFALLEESDWDAVMEVNVKGAYLFTRAALRPMIRARGGHVLNIGSFSSDRLLDAPVHYAASKAALRGFTEALAKEVGRYGVAVNYLSPGLLDAGMGTRLPAHRIEDYRQQCALRRRATPDEIAAMATWLVSDENSWMTGARLVIDGGL